VGQGDVVLLQKEIPVPTVEGALAEARRAGDSSVLNTAPVRSVAAALLCAADVVVANETEFALYGERLGLDGSDRDTAMRAFAARFGNTLVVTLGGDGVAAAAGDRLVRRPAPKIEPVDTVGAGDTFCGYLAAALSGGLALEPALARAATAGSLACLRPGAQPAIPRAAEVDAAMSAG
jgi:ribokinase